MTGSMETDNNHRALTGVHIILSDGGTDAAREQRAAAFLDTGLFQAASRFQIIEGTPKPPAWLEVFETGLQDPLSAYTRARDALPRQPAADDLRQRSSRSFALVAAHQADPQACDWSAPGRQSLERTPFNSSIIERNSPWQPCTTR